MLSAVRTYLVIVLGLIVFIGASQSNLMLKRLLPFKNYQNYQETHLVDVFNVGYEYELNQHFSVGAELFYSNYKPVLPDYYSQVDWGSSKFHDRSAGLGIFSRRYFGQSSVRLFLQAGFQVSFIHIKQPILVRANYKDQLRIINNGEWIPSGTLAVGGSFGDGRLKYEPYLQVGMAKTISETRGNSTLIAALGRRSTGENVNWLLVPISLKWGLEGNE